MTRAARCASPGPAAKASVRPDSGPGATRLPSASPLVAVRLPDPGQVKLALLNGTARNGLARSVGNALAARGFRVSGMGNAGTLAGATRVFFGPGGRPAATLAVGHVLGAQLIAMPDAPADSVRVVLGTSFVRLRTPAEVRAFARSLPAAGGRAAEPASAGSLPPSLAPSLPPGGPSAAAPSPSAGALLVVPTCR